MQEFNRQFHYLDEEGLPVIRGIGLGSGGPRYDWDARKRKENLIVLQVTLAGKGRIATKQETTELPVEKAFLAEIPGPFRYYGQDWSFLFIEFSPVIHQWLDRPFELLDLSQEFCAELVKKLTVLNQGEWSLYQNSQVAFQLLLDLKGEMNQQRLRQSPKMLQVKDYLEANYAQDIGLDDLEAYFKTSRFSLIRQFERVYQQTPMKYLQMYRINQSLHLLWSGNEVQEVAQLVGFTSANYFGKVFKQQIGLTPKDYQKKRFIYRNDL